MFESKPLRLCVTGLCCLGLCGPAGSATLAADPSAGSPTLAADPSAGTVTLAADPSAGTVTPLARTQTAADATPASSSGLSTTPPSTTPPSTTPLSTTRPSTNSIRDVTLDQDGSLRGQLLDQHSAAKAGTRVELVQRGDVVAASTIDAEGNFRFAGLSGGLYQVRTAQASRLVRAWRAGTAPPHARNGLLLVADRQTVRGNFGGITDGVFRAEEWRSMIALGAVIGAGAAVQGVRQNDAS
ncbi:MAG: carboxypeptidase regulatory-like domain-containing protein [Planctomycetota bacterium]|nr:MAG: carboxypeptidase regulatory-like domain-containing protein [Planctomycetota bacterium]